MTPVETCSDAYSDVFGYLSIYCWLVAQIPQQVENYRNKRCDGISLSFLILWFLGDLTSLVGCLLTGQLQFQIYLAIYFLYNDCVLFGQWYYYSFIYKSHHHHLHHHHHHHQAYFNNENNNEIPIIDGILVGQDSAPVMIPSSRKPSFIKSSLLVASSMISSVKGATIHSSNTNQILDMENIGAYISWICAALYLGARFPQLYKNYQRKSVAGISPLLFFTLIIANLCYSASICLNCKFNYNFFIKELPYILGSSGTVIFDLMYFYQKRLYGNNPISETTRLI